MDRTRATARQQGRQDSVPRTHLRHGVQAAPAIGLKKEGPILPIPDVASV
jgi:hypothetical protein